MLTEQKWEPELWKVQLTAFPWQGWDQVTPASHVLLSGPNGLLRALGWSPH